ncbi:JAB domain-containing protein [Empedobacter sp. UBA2044]|nr:JAB domain-containing protein [Empedobacter sp. UBA2044]
MKEGATLLDIQVLDHIIVSQKDFYSFADDGLI